MADTDWMDGEVDETKELLNKGQVYRLIEHNNALKDLVTLEGVCLIKKGIADGELDLAKECWVEMDQDTQNALWIAPSYGGIFTTEERKIMKGGFNGN